MVQTRPVSDLNDKLTPDERIRLSIIISRLKSGDESVLITPVGKRVGPDELFASWTRVFDANVSKMNDVLIGIEKSQMEKFGPRSIAKPLSEIESEALSTFDMPNVNCDHLDRKPLSSSDKGIIRPASLNTAFDNLRKDTNSGLPYLRKTGLIIDDLKGNLLREYDEDYPAVPFVRTQEQGRTRIVNGFPKSDIVIESTYFIPLFNYYRKQPCFSAMIGPSAVSSNITRLISESVRLGLPCVSGDISRFDFSFGTDLQNAVFDEFGYLVQDGYQSGLNEIAYRFGNKPLIIGDNICYGPHGIPSGSQFTNLVGSVGNRKVCDLPTELTQFLGDDFAAVTGKPEDLFDKYSSCGLELNREKTVIANGYFLYLQNLFHPDYMEDGEIKGVYPTYRALNRLIYPERFSDFESFDLDGKSYFAIRSLSILENCRYHPLFEKFVTWWLKYEKYAIPSNQSIANYVKYVNATTGSLGTMNQVGDEVRGLTSFASYRIAKRFVES